MAGGTVTRGLETLMPNALLVAAAIGALNATCRSRSAKSDEVGRAVGKDAAWVHRHGKTLGATFGWHEEPQAEGVDADIFDDLAARPEAQAMARHERGPIRWPLTVANLSPNGHDTLTAFGEGLARLLRTARPTLDAPAKCPQCGCQPSSGVIAGRRLYACGQVEQFCPDAVPGHDRAEVPARSRKAQHSGTWFGARACGRRNGREDATADGTPMALGLLVSASFGSGAHGRYGSVVGTVRAFANGVALVDWPETARGPELPADIVEASQLVVPGAPDPTGLSDYQSRLWDAVRRGQVLLEVSDEGVYLGRFESRSIVARALEVLIEHRLLPPVPEAPQPRPLFGGTA